MLLLIIIWHVAFDLTYYDLSIMFHEKNKTFYPSWIHHKSLMKYNNFNTATLKKSVFLKSPLEGLWKHFFGGPKFSRYSTICSALQILACFYGSLFARNKIFI